MNSISRKQAGLAALFLVLAAGPAWADPPPRPVLDAEALSARIDQLLAAKWAEKEVKPAARAGDSEFLRRLSLDLNGRIPTIIDVSDFIADDRPDKRRIWVEKLLNKKASADPADPGLYVMHFTNYWRTVIFSQTTGQQRAFLQYQLDGWLRKQLEENAPYDKLVRELLTTPQQAQPFYGANENKPENIASNVSRLFLGVKLECAQCHDDRSGGSWTRTQFWETAAFFATMPQGNRFGQPAAIPTSSDGKAPRIKIPDTKDNKYVEAKFLDGTEPPFRAGVSSLAVLSEWMTSKENPYFARAAVNRMWYYFLGTGLVDPVDQMGTEENPPSHPELLDELAYQFAAHNFDLKYLIRAICGSQAYQLTSVQSHETQEYFFGRMAVRGLSPEQLFDSVQLATGYKDNSPAGMGRGFGFQPNSPRGEFVAKFFNDKDRRTETQTSILQALYLMNSKWMTEAHENGKTLTDTFKTGPQVPVSKRIEDLYMITLSRKPRPDEMERLLKYVENGGPVGDPKKALADVFWALLNSAEFILNH